MYKVYNNSLKVLQKSKRIIILYKTKIDKESFNAKILHIS